MYLVDKPIDVKEIGGKARNLLELKIPNTPKLYVVKSSFFDDYNHNKNILDKLQEEIQKNFTSKKKYAVRSSAIDEDSSKNSFAGIHDSFLNVEKEQIIENIFKVYHSAFSDNAIKYRLANNISTDDIKIAVIIQEMIDADFAGVINTINPITNNPDEIVISVVKGLGESLVSGEKDSSDYFINGSNIKINGEDVLNKKLVKKLIEFTKQIVMKTTSFQDIEFCIKNNKVYFLQTRDITTYYGINPHKRTMFIDNSNIIESYFGTTSYLTFTFAKDVYRDVYTSTLRMGKTRERLLDKLKPSLSNMLYYYNNRIYYNMRSWYHVNSIFPFKKSTTYMENMMGVKHSSDDFKRVKMNVFDMIKLGVLFIKKVRNIDELSDDFENKFNQVVLPYYGKKIEGTNEELTNLFKSIESNIVSDFAVPIINDSAVMIYYGMLKERLKKKYPEGYEELLNKLISNNGNVLSVGSATNLKSIVDYIKKDFDVLNDFRMLTKDQLFVKYHHAKLELSKMIKEYITNFGSRVMDELKLETITMIEDESLIYEYLKNSLDSQEVLGNNKEEAIDVDKSIQKLATKAKKFIKNRERLRLKRTYVYSVVRNLFLAFGNNYYSEGRLATPRDVFYLSKSEVLSGKGNFLELVKERKKIELENQDKPYCDRVVFYKTKTLEIRNSVKEGLLTGIPSGNGVVKARVSLMEKSTDFLKPGNIILTKRTDPGWISLFPRCSGLIVEHGSMLSHSFVVAREMNIPAVVGVSDATKIIKNNDLVTLDGLKGSVTIEN